MKVWNNHIIRPSKNPNVPSGRPNVMYTVPRLYRTQDFVQPVQKADIDSCEPESLHRSLYTCDQDIYDVCMFIMKQHNVAWPRTPREGIYFFLQLKEKTYEALGQ